MLIVPNLFNKTKPSFFFHPHFHQRKGKCEAVPFLLPRYIEYAK
jgi:hypothetical protein